jgi:hypothetical protein
MKRMLQLLIAVAATCAFAQTNDVDWWASRTNWLQTYEHSGFPGSVRLDSYTSGFVEGRIALPASGEWHLRVVVVTDETETSPEEHVDLYLNGAFA